jgi:AsmA protein
MWESIGVIIGLLSITLVILIWVVDINNHKDKIAKVLKKHTGRTFNFQDKIHLTAYPWVGVDLGEVTLGNAPGFEESDFAQIDKVKVRVKLIPLLKKHFEIDTILLKGVTVNLTRKPDGSTNWDDLVSDGKDKKDKKAQKAEKKQALYLEKLHIHGLDVRLMKVVFDDQQTQSHYSCSVFLLKTSRIVLNEPIQVQFKTVLNLNHAASFTGQVELKTQMTVLLNKNT